MNVKVTKKNDFRNKELRNLSKLSWNICWNPSFSIKVDQKKKNDFRNKKLKDLKKKKQLWNNC